MGQTITEKILQAHTDSKDIRAGEFILAKVDIALANDVTAPIAIQEFRNVGATKVFDKKKVTIVPDHFTPNKDIKSAEQCKFIREFAHEQDLENYFEIGQMGIEHVLLPEQGVVVSGDLVIGADSHTCTYGALGAFSTGVGSTDLGAAMATGEVWFKVPESIKFIYTGKLKKWVSGKDLILYTIGQIGVDGALYRSMEFTGPLIDALDMDNRFTICNMAIEAGAKNGIIAPDATTDEYVKAHNKKNKPVTCYASDDDAEYAETYEWDLSGLEPQIAFPHLPENTKPVSEASDITIDQVVIGSCTNGRITDLRIAAEILKGRTVAKGVRAIVLPGTQTISKQAMHEGLFDIFIDAGCVVSTPTCGPCLGGHMGILAKGERAISSTNRNFVGRMGHPESEVYLASPAVCAASAVTGRITHPEVVMR